MLAKSLRCSAFDARRGSEEELHRRASSDVAEDPAYDSFRAR